MEIDKYNKDFISNDLTSIDNNNKNQHFVTHGGILRDYIDYNKESKDYLPLKKATNKNNLLTIKTKNNNTFTRHAQTISNKLVDSKLFGHIFGERHTNNIIWCI